MGSVHLQLTSVTIGTLMPHDLAHFSARLLGWTVTALAPPRPGEPATAGWAQVRPPADVWGPILNVAFERWFQRPVWPAVPGGADRDRAPGHPRR